MSRYIKNVRRQNRIIEERSHWQIHDFDFGNKSEPCRRLIFDSIFPMYRDFWSMFYISVACVENGLIVFNK